MNQSQFIRKVSKYGKVEAIKEGIVFTLLLTGSGLMKSSTVSEIGKLAIEYMGDKYPNIEVMSNDENYFLIILKP